ncbi:monooxygenase [Salinisphaera sp. PC39]|uniref:flavin-containing monooxygenase n=1 Tax=Salinisphaera sp. PC39 TaxID=1304156 RepID=UPI003341ACA7
MAAEETNPEEFDVLIVGAGLSGVGMACHLQMESPGKSFAILERRQAIGGTWDLFRYPGIRSDSDMFSFGYEFRPWHEPKVLADGPSIRNYVAETAREYGVEDKIRFGLRITRADWSSEEARWTLTAVHEPSGETRHYRCHYLVLCTGYYRYDAGYMPEFPGIERYRGTVVHPQNWPEGLDYEGKRVVVIGSGATAMTLVPAMAPDTGHITMLQRSPSYIISLPAFDKISAWLKRILPDDWVFAMARRRNIRLQRILYTASQRYPRFMRWLLMRGVRKQLGKDFDMRHFSPSYNPWDERLCAVPDADLFKVLREGRASVVTDHIDTFTEDGIRLRSGKTLEADIVIAATGLEVQLMGGMEIAVDGETRPPNEVMTYKGVLIEDAPNLAVIFGYTNASWTLKADIAAKYICRLLNHMDAEGYVSATPRDEEGCAEEDTSVLDSLSAGYVRRASHRLPRQGRKLPWRVLNHYLRDRKILLEEPIEDGYLAFDREVRPRKQQAA